MAPPHPLRRISTGSLSSLHRSQDRTHASPSGLDFLQPALTELSDEAATLATNVDKLNELHDALGQFNESFAGLIWALKMNAFCVEWPEAPTKLSFDRAPSLAVPEPQPAYSSQQPLSPTPAPSSHATTAGPSQGDQTYATEHSFVTQGSPVAPPPKKVLAKKPAAASGPAAKKAAMAARKKREMEISGIIDTLPLEFRGSQPSQRLAMEKIIMKLMDGRQLAIADLISLPDLPHPRVNKCLIALVGRKLVTKHSEGGRTEYRWVGV
ncbi:DASH complex subunit Dam1-domain-containing protein [Papiliotrema laurentii]|uniref:DASH complex subunit DAM1 n=1 Tax=Papiliotrema laurentii TaxID=5418 RepID=A0AAD9CX62_PAPLA|nr:DASH complex subunit Dam1-domain-containing protein [Papiliotrema laurentii]